MFRNVESHFAHVPQANINRSVFKRPKTHTTSFNFGDLIPIYVDSDILPGDSVKMNVSKIVRLQTLMAPVLGDMYLDVFWFFVPHRLVWNHWKEFMGENTQTKWVQPIQYQVPCISAPSGGFETGTIADYMGLPVGVNWNATDKLAPIALPFRAYALICQEFFRSEDLTDALNIPVGDANQTGTNSGANYINDVPNGGQPFKVAKFHDFFTSCLPSAQKASAPVTFPLISGTDAPVFTKSDSAYASLPSSITKVPLHWEHIINSGSSIQVQKYYNLIDGIGLDGVGATSIAGPQTVAPVATAYPRNLWADLSSSVGAVTVNELRLAFQLQKFYERQARSGSRYTELIRSFFGIVSPDARLQRPEYLGGNRVPINIHEVTNSYQEANASPSVFLGDVGAKSATVDVHFDIDHSFTEHGTLMCVCCARYTHVYSSGLEKMWMKKSRFDYFFPVFDALGEMPVPDACLHATSTNIASGSTFGFNEAWAEYRFANSYCSGEMRPTVHGTGKTSLATWNLAEKYTSSPTLSDGWIREDKNIVDRVLAVGSSVSNQIFGDFFFDATYTRPMSIYSVPGLIDHF